jgi:hypothetical protein
MDHQRKKKSVRGRLLSNQGGEDGRPCCYANRNYTEPSVTRRCTAQPNIPFIFLTGFGFLTLLRTVSPELDFDLMFETESVGAWYQSHRVRVLIYRAAAEENSDDYRGGREAGGRTGGRGAIAAAGGRWAWPDGRGTRGRCRQRRTSVTPRCYCSSYSTYTAVATV